MAVINKVGTLHEKAGFVEYKMPYAMAKSYLATRTDGEKKMPIEDFLVKIVNEQFNLKGQCVKVIQY